MLLLSQSLALAAPCNPKVDAYEALPPFTDSNHRSRPPKNLIKLPQPKGQEATYPAALDGTPYAFYFTPNATSTKWTININGGGWCYDEDDCLCRSYGALGSSKAYAVRGHCACMNPLPDGAADLTCNCIQMNYLDGASFSGYRAEPLPVPNSKNSSALLWFRGLKNLDATLDYAFAHGMDKATEFVLTGGSAGGLSTFLHADRVAARLKDQAPNCKKVRAAPVVGFFLDHDNFRHSNGYSANGTGGPNTPQWSDAHSGTGANYTFWMKYVYSMQNMTFGEDGGLTAACQRKHPTEPHLCFMSPHMADVIETPLFMFNSQYDQWQLDNELQATYNAGQTKEFAGVIQYGKDFITQLTAAGIGANGSQHGGVITSCICHGCPWGGFVLDGKTGDQWYADWYYGVTAGGPESLHVDRRLPNGGGAMGNHKDHRWLSCSPFPDPSAQANPHSCSGKEFCGPHAKRCLTPTLSSCTSDAACASGDVCCPLTKTCATPGAVCTPTPQCNSTEYCNPARSTTFTSGHTGKCLTPTDPGVFCSAKSPCKSAGAFCCKLTNLCVSAGARCNPAT